MIGRGNVDHAGFRRHQGTLGFGVGRQLIECSRFVVASLGIPQDGDCLWDELAVRLTVLEVDCLFL